jgi:hypothetical protein
MLKSAEHQDDEPKSLIVGVPKGVGSDIRRALKLRQYSSSKWDEPDDQIGRYRNEVILSYSHPIFLNICQGFGRYDHGVFVPVRLNHPAVFIMTFKLRPR